MAFQYNLRRQIPQRTCTKQLSYYRGYRPYLKKDFNERCGYCDLTILHNRLATIEHFAPQKQFPHLKSAYKNLIYSCQMCNKNKSGDWPMSHSTPSHNGQQGYVDPCLPDYDSHLARRSDGQIYGKTPVGEYMVKQLKLHLRNRIVEWQSDMLRDKALEVREILAKCPDHPEHDALRSIYEQMKNLLNHRSHSKWKIII